MFFTPTNGFSTVASVISPLNVIMKYAVLALLVLFLGSSGVVWVQAKQINKMHERLGTSKQTVELLASANETNLVTIGNLVLENKRCTTMRAEAGTRAEQALLELVIAEHRINDETKQRQDAVRRALALANAENADIAMCDSIPYDSRVTGLLVEAARSANRAGSDN